MAKFGGIVKLTCSSGVSSLFVPLLLTGDEVPLMSSRRLFEGLDLLDLPVLKLLNF